MALTTVTRPIPPAFLAPAPVPAPEPLPVMAPVSIRTVMLATDLSAVSGLATDRAIELAGRLATRLVIIHVIDERAFTGARGQGTRIDQLRRRREEELLEVTRRAGQAAVRCDFLVWEGDVAKTIVAAAEAERADLVIVGSRGPDRTGRFPLGSVSDHVVHYADCPVLVVRPVVRPERGASF